MAKRLTAREKADKEAKDLISHIEAQAEAMGSQLKALKTSLSELRRRLAEHAYQEGEHANKTPVEPKG